MTTILFTLTMPSSNSWNGRWSGEGQSYCKTRKLSGKKGAEKAQKIAESGGYYSYGFGDGWRAGVSARIVDSVAARKAMKTSRGFCGYDWMIDSIIAHGGIYTEAPKPELATS